MNVAHSNCKSPGEGSWIEGDVPLENSLNLLQRFSNRLDKLQRQRGSAPFLLTFEQAIHH